MSISGTVCCSILYFAISLMQAFMDVFLDCNILDKAEELSVVLNSDIDKNNYVSIKDLRSRYDKFVIGHYCVHIRNREPSRIPVKRITRVLNKSRNIRCLLRSYIRREVPLSSRMHRYVSRNTNSMTKIAHRIKSKLKNDNMRWVFGIRSYEKSLKCKMKLAKNNFNPVCLITGIVARDFNAYKNDSTLCVYKNLNHRVSHNNFILSRDIETNPGPIDPTMTIQAPYSQDNVVLFGFNAGTQCVAMSLTSLIFAHRNNGISSPMDLKFK